MLFNELYESPQLDEINMSQLGYKLGQGVGSAARAVKSAVRGKPQAQPAPGTTQMATQTGAINPITGRAYVPSDFPDNPPAAPPASTAPAAPPPPPAPGIQPSAARSGTVQQAKQAVDAAVNAIGKVRSRDKPTAVAYATKAVSKISNAPVSAPTAGATAFGQMTRQLSQPTSSTGGQRTVSPTGVTHTAAPTNPNQPAATTAATPTPAATWTGRPAVKAKPATKPSKISAAPPAGAATPGEYANLERQIQAAKAKMTPVTEALAWSKTFDPSRTLMRKIQRS